LTRNRRMSLSSSARRIRAMFSRPNQSAAPPRRAALTISV
jgi:hypothetical protein